ncbi:hypothetical protein DMJ13_20355 [halophilic archaeon]|nr:hypothetical protein DMJ13_20355 [halophilic archaeon]
MILIATGGPRLVLRILEQLHRYRISCDFDLGDISDIVFGTKTDVRYTIGTISENNRIANIWEVLIWDLLGADRAL